MECHRVAPPLIRDVCDGFLVASSPGFFYFFIYAENDVWSECTKKWEERKEEKKRAKETEKPGMRSHFENVTHS